MAYATVGSTTSTAIDPTGEQNLRSADVFGGQLYVSSQKSLVLATVGSGTPTTAPQTLTNLPGLPTAGSDVNANEFFLAKVNPASPGVDTLYITDQTANAAAGQVDKYSLVSGVWVARGSFAVGVGASGLAGVVTGSSVKLYVTSSGSLGTAGTVYQFTDNSGYNSTVAGTATVLVSAGINEAFRGVAIAPTAVPDTFAPVFDLNGAAGGTSYTTSWSNAGAVLVTDAAATVTDADTTNLTQLTVALASPHTGDTLAANNAAHPGIAWSFAGNTLTLSGSASQSDYTDILRTITYNNTSPPVGVGQVVLNFSASDGTLTSTTETTTINVADVVDLNGAAGGTGFSNTYDGVTAANVADAANATVNGPGAANLTQMTVAISGTHTGDVLAATLSGGITSTFASGTLTLSGSSSVANYQAVLRTVKYSNTVGPGVDTITINVQGKDATNVLTNTATSTISLPPVLDLNGATTGSSSTSGWFNSGKVGLEGADSGDAVARRRPA